MSIGRNTAQKLERGVILHPKQGFRLVSTRKAMEMTGFTQSWLWQLGHLGRIRFLKISTRRIYYYEKDIMDILT